MVILYMSIVWLAQVRSTKYMQVSETTAPKIGITIITDKGPMNLDQNMLEHYLNRLKENIEYLSKRVDPEKCEYIKKELTQAKDSLKDQVVQTSEAANAQTQSTIQIERAKLKTRINKVSDILFENNQNPDGIKSILLEIILDLETLMYLTKIIPMQIKNIDVQDIDQIARVVYENACVPEYQAESTSDFVASKLDPDTPFEDSFSDGTGNLNDKIPSQFGIFADNFKNQDLTETRIGTSSYNPSLKNRKKNLKNLRQASLDMETLKKEKDRSLSIKKFKVAPQSEGVDIVKDRVIQMKDNFISERPDRYKKKKNSLVGAYSYLFDPAIYPGVVPTHWRAELDVY